MPCPYLRLHYLTAGRSPVNHDKLNKFKDILLNPYWLVFSLTGIIIFFFALNRGGTNVFIWACSFFLLAHLVWGEFSLNTLPLLYWVALVACVALIFMSLAFSYEITHKDRIFRLIKMLIIIFTIHLTSRIITAEQAFGVFGAALALSVAWQFAARIIFGMPNGTWQNPHYLANFAILSLPLLFYYSRTAPKPYKYLFLVLIVMDIDPVLRNASRPAFVALVASTLFVVTFFTHSRYRYIGLSAISACFIILGITNYAGFFDTLKELIANISNEERVYIWKYSLEMLQDNSLSAWLVGNGIGSTYDVLQKYALPDPLYQAISFPHNFLIQILFENGIIGSVVVFGGLTFLMCLFIKLSKAAVDTSEHLFINCMIAVFLNCIIFTCLTVGFYSKYTLYPLGFIIGIAFVLAENSLDKSNDRKPWEPLPHLENSLNMNPLSENKTERR